MGESWARPSFVIHVMLTGPVIKYQSRLHRMMRRPGCRRIHRGGRGLAGLAGHIKNKESGFIEKAGGSCIPPKPKVSEPGLHANDTSPAVCTAGSADDFVLRMRRPRICEVQSRNKSVTKSLPTKQGFIKHARIPMMKQGPQKFYSGAPV